MSTATATARGGRVTRMRDAIAGVPTFLREVRQEMRRVTWPDRVQLRQATIAIVVFVLVIGGIIAILDLLIQLVLVRGVPSIVT